MEKNAKIVVFGARGLIGKEIVKELLANSFTNVFPCGHEQLELINQAAVNTFFEVNKPEYIFFCATRSITNFETGECIDAVEMYSNIIMQLNVMEAARIYGVKKAAFLGSAMLYPWTDKYNNILLNEDLLDDFNITQYRPSMKSTVLSKYVSMKMCHYYYAQYGCKYIYAIPTHIYGGFANRKNLYFLEDIVINLCNAKKNNEEVVKLDIFGEGKAKKQILHVSDCANAIITAMEKYEDYSLPINIGSQEIVSWSDVVREVCQIIDYKGKVLFNTEHQERMENRICDIRRLESLGWKQQISIHDGLESLCEEWFQTNGK